MQKLEKQKIIHPLKQTTENNLYIIHISALVL